MIAAKPSGQESATAPSVGIDTSPGAGSGGVGRPWLSAQSCARSPIARGFIASGTNSAKRPARMPIALSFCRSSWPIFCRVSPGLRPSVSRSS